MNKTIYFVGIVFLFIGLFWLHSSDLIYHLNDDKKDEHNEEEIDLKFSLIGLIPTLFGLYLIENYNKNAKRVH
ncbi:MAG: hypothetical protein AABW83_02150 [Nanoarchaeota archaeon]